MNTTDTQITNDDNKSVASGGSTLSSSLEKMECPYCNKDFQTRHMVNHIHSKHSSDFLNGLTKKWIEDAEKDEPLKLYWEKNNDFDELEIMNLYACMGTYKTFLREDRARLHFKKNPDALKKHNKEISKLKKAYEKKKEQDRKQADKNPYLASYQKAAESNDIELVKGLYRYNLHLIEIIERVISYTRKEVPLDTVSDVGNRYGEKFSKMKVSELITLFNETRTHFNNAINEKLISYRVINEISNRLQRILELREICLWAPRFAYYKSITNPEGMLLSGDACFGYVHPSMPPSPF